MISSILAFLISPVVFILAGVLTSYLAKKYNAFGESTGITLAALILVSVPVVLITGCLALVLPGVTAQLFLRAAAFFSGFGVTTYLIDRADRG